VIHLRSTRLLVRLRALLRNMSLKARLLAMMLFLCTITLASMVYIQVSSEHQILEALERQNDSLSQAIQVSVEQLTLPGATDEAKLKSYVERLRRQGIKEVSILSNEQTVIASSNPLHVGARVAGRHGDLFIRADVGEVDFETPQRTYNLIVPVVVGDEQRGYAHVVMHLEDVTRLLRDTVLQRLAAMAVVFGLGIAASVYLSKRYTKPLFAVVEAAEGVASGNLDLRVPIPAGSSEIAALARTFNQMVERLRQQRALEERLRRAEQMGAVGQLASGMAHEIRNPLNFISLSIDRLRSRFAPAAEPDRREFQALLGSVREEIRHLKDLMDNFLRYGRPLKLNPRRVDVEAAVRSVLEFLEPRLTQQNIRAGLRRITAAPWVEADPGALRTCLMNLLVNAIHAMPQGGELSVEMDGDAAELEIRVIDTGTGIAPEHLERVFEPYFTTKEAGIGLGLAITRKIVEEHGARIRVDSEPGRGTRITLHFRRRLEPACETATSWSSTTTATSAIS
jgi:signal transduction histidine kinase